MTAPESPPPPPPRGLHRFAVAVALTTLLMISVGALVTSKDAGLSVPDWPTAYGGLFPSRWLEIENVRAELAHRWIGATLGALVIALAVAIRRLDPRAWMHRLGWAAVALVCLQGVVGGVGVRWLQPAWLSVPHAFLAQTLLCLVAAIAYLTSREGASGAVEAPGAGADRIRRGLRVTTALVFVQLLLGATFRHANLLAGFFAHAVVAFGILGSATGLWLRARDRVADAPWLARGTTALVALVTLQIGLGVFAWVFREPKGQSIVRSTANVSFPTVHVVVGALVLASALLLTLRAETRWRRSAATSTSAAREARDGSGAAALAAKGTA